MTVEATEHFDFHFNFPIFCGTLVGLLGHISNGKRVTWINKRWDTARVKEKKKVHSIIIDDDKRTILSLPLSPLPPSLSVSLSLLVMHLPPSPPGAFLSNLAGPREALLVLLQTRGVRGCEDRRGRTRATVKPASTRDIVHIRHPPLRRGARTAWFRVGRKGKQALLGCARASGRSGVRV